MAFDRRILLQASAMTAAAMVLHKPGNAQTPVIPVTIDSRQVTDLLAHI